jgi:hypothetical protein
MYPPFYYRSPTDLYPPIMPAGLNSATISGDEFNGGGVNEPIWTYYFDTSEVFKPIWMTDEIMDNFENEQPDLVIPGVRWNINLPGEVRTLTIKATS